MKLQAVLSALLGLSASVTGASGAYNRTYTIPASGNGSDDSPAIRQAFQDYGKDSHKYSRKTPRTTSGLYYSYTTSAMSKSTCSVHFCSPQMSHTGSDMEACTGFRISQSPWSFLGTESPLTAMIKELLMGKDRSGECLVHGNNEWNM
jgi:hypothetical protein